MDDLEDSALEHAVGDLLAAVALAVAAHVVEPVAERGAVMAAVP